MAKADELPEGDRRIVVAGNDEIGVFHHGGAYYAYSNYCVHSGGPACEGIMINKVVDLIAEDRTYQGQTFADEMHFVCPWHGYEYELETGRCVVRLLTTLAWPTIVAFGGGGLRHSRRPAGTGKHGCRAHRQCARNDCCALCVD